MKHVKKMAAPIVIAVFFILYYIVIAVVLMSVSGIPAIVRFLMIVIPLALSAVMLGALISRIKEIIGGEEDDISQY